MSERNYIGSALCMSVRCRGGVLVCKGKVVGWEVRFTARLVYGSIVKRKQARGGTNLAKEKVYELAKLLIAIADAVQILKKTPL